MAGREGRDAHILPQRWLSPVSPWSARELRIVRAEGAHVWDEDGNRYLDLVTNGGISVLGHAHPELVAALSTQVTTLMGAHATFDNDAREEFVEALSVLVPPPLARIVLTNSGSEAVDAAVRLARTATRRSRVVAMEGAYHGTTLLAAALSDSGAAESSTGEALLDVQHIPFGDIDALEQALRDPVAAVVIEPLQWQAGARMAPNGYLQALQQLCHGAGALLVVDEVQTALRTWPALLSVRYGVTPDLLCLGPSIANGLPAGAVVMSDAVGRKARRGVWEGTTAGNPVSSAAGAATLRVLASPTMRVRLAESGARLQARLRALRISEIKEVRGEGTLAAVELRGAAAPVERALRREMVLVGTLTPNTIALMPPAGLDSRQVDFVVEKLALAIVEARRRRRGTKVATQHEVELRGVAARRAAGTGAS